jgi:hypothetical protein
LQTRPGFEIKHRAPISGWPATTYKFTTAAFGPVVGVVGTTAGAGYDFPTSAPFSYPLAQNIPITKSGNTITVVFDTDGGPNNALSSEKTMTVFLVRCL